MALISKASLLMVPSTYEQEKLYNVLPSGNRAPDSTDQNSGYDQTRADFTFDRGSNAAATRIGSDGLIKKYRENLLVQSNQFDTTWFNSNSTETSGQSGYDGSSDAWLLESTGPSGSLRQSISYSSVICYSFYAKAGTVNYVRLRLDAATQVNAWFNLSSGSVGTLSDGISSSIESVGNGWWRVSVTANVTSLTTIRVYPSPNDAGGNSSGDNIYIQNAQLESGLVSTDYLDSGATTAKARVLIDLPRINYDANGENGALLLEPQRANSTTYSEYIGASGVGALSVTNNTNATKSPEGLYNATLIAEDTTTGYHRIGISHGSMSNATKTFSVFAKWAGGSGRKWLTMDNGPICYFDLENGTKGNVGANCTADIEDYGNGWYRCHFTHTSSSSGTLYIGTASANGGAGNHLGNGEDAMYFYGVQAEDGASYVSSYIPNHGESGGVTRAADSCSVTGVSDVIGQTEGTLFFDVNISRVVGNEAIGTINSGGYANHVTIQRIGNTIQFVRNSATQSGATIVTSATISAGRYKLAIAYKSGDTACFLNGTQVSTTQTQTFTNASLSVVRMSGDAIGAIPISDSVKQATLFKERLTNSELATLTTL